MQLSGTLGLLTLSLYVSHASGLEHHQVPLSDVELQTDSASTIINFDDLHTNFGTGLGASNSFTYSNLTFKSFLVASIPIVITRAYQPWNVNEVYCLGSAPNVIVGSRSNTSNLWPTISTCSLSDDLKENKCNGTFNVVSFRMRPMGNMLGQADGVRLTFLSFDFLRLSELDVRGDRETLLRGTIPDDLGSGSEPGFDPPPKPGFPPFDGTKTAFQLVAGWFRSGPAPPSRVEIKRFRPGFATNVDTMQIYGFTYPVSGSGVEPVDWPFCIDDLELEFIPEETEKDEAGQTDMSSERKRDKVWREEIYF